VREQAAQYFQALAFGHDAYAALSTRGRNQLVPDSGHFIQIENPAVVLAALNRVLKEIAVSLRNTRAGHRLQFRAPDTQDRWAVSC